MTGIIVAMGIEAETLAGKMKNLKTEERGGLKFYRGSISDKEIIMVESGIGKVNAAYATAVMIERYNPGYIISTGIAGGLGKLKVFDLIVAESVVQHDFDTTPFGDPPGLLPGINLVNIPASERLVDILIKALPGAVKGVIASGDQFIASDEKARKIADLFGASACDMESAAIAQVARRAEKGFAAIRVISDGGGDADEITFSRFAKEASVINSEAVAAAMGLVD